MSNEDFPRGLTEGLISREKRAERAALLEAHPELRRRIDLAPLLQIIDFVDFKCHGSSSVARDQAIEGSDIDVGLVMTRDQTTADEERRFVEELRAQGFTAYDSREVEAARAAKFDELSEMSIESRELGSRNVDQQFALIDFKTIADLEAGEATQRQMNIFRRGYSILYGTTDI